MVFEIHTGEEYLRRNVCLQKLHSIICVHSLAYFHASVWSRSLVLYWLHSCMKYGTQCGETRTTLAEMQSSVSSVGVQSKGIFIMFPVIQMFPAIV